MTQRSKKDHPKVSISEIQEINREIDQTKTKYNKNGFINALDIYNLPIYTMQYLLKPIFPKIGLVGIVGSSDTGKSTFVRQLLIAIVSNLVTFLGFTLFATHSRAIYVSTEDFMDDLSPILKETQQKLNIEVSAFERLIYVFNSENIIQRLKALLESNPVDVIVIDSFADIFGGGDMNNVGQIRNFLNDFSELANQYHTLVIFVHHTKKRSEEQIPSKHNSVGSHGFEAKVRTLLEFRKDVSKSNIRHLCVVKGNYIPEEAKNQSYVLTFEDRVFKETGERVLFNDLKATEQDWDLINNIMDLSQDGLTQREIAEKLGINKNKVNRTLSRYKK